MNNLYTRTLAALALVALALVAIVTPGPRALDAQTSRYTVYATSRTTLTTTGRDLAVATSASSALSTLGGVATSRTIAGTALSSDISAATLRSGLSLPAAAPALSTSGRLVYLLADSIGGSDGGAVSSWADGVSGRSAVQATGANQPLYYSGASGEGLNGRAVVRCDGTNDRLTIAGEAALDVSTLTLYLVARARRNSGSTLPASVVIIQRPYDLAGSSPYSEIGFWVPNSSQIEYRADGTASSYASVGNTGSDWATPHVLVLTVGAGGSSLHVDGVRQATSATTSVAYNTANLNWALCADGYTTAGEWWRGDIGAVALYSGAHTSAQRRANEGALCMYYGLVCASGDT